ncbi:MAG: hypothetical protein ACUVYA_17010, partial [Planctomycetota bacterium]
VLAAAICVLCVSAAAPLPAAEISTLKQSLQDALRRDDLAGAAKAVTEIGALDTPQALELVVLTALKSSKRRVYEACVNAFASTANEAVVDHLARLLKSKNPAEASLAAEILIKVEGFGEKRQKALVAAFLDLGSYPKSEAVQTVILPWLEANGSSLWALRALIDLRIQLAKRRIADGRLFYNLADALWKVTGQDYDKPAEWEKYWKIRAAEGERPAGEEKGEAAARKSPRGELVRVSRTSVARKLPKFFGMEVRSSHALFIIDVSGSMTRVDARQRAGEEPEEEPGEASARTGRTAVAKAARRGSKPEPDFGEPGKRTRMQRVKRQLYRMIERYPDGRDFALITFGSKVEVVYAAKRGEALHPISMNPATRAEALEKILGLTPSGLTRTDLAFETAFSFEGIDTIYLLSDGFPQRDPNYPNLPPAERQKVVDELMHEIVEYVAQRNRAEGRRWEIHTFGFPEAMLGNFLQVLARENYGNYWPID